MEQYIDQKLSFPTLPHIHIPYHPPTNHPNYQNKLKEKGIKNKDHGETKFQVEQGYEYSSRSGLR